MFKSYIRNITVFDPIALSLILMLITLHRFCNTLKPELPLIQESVVIYRGCERYLCQNYYKHTEIVPLKSILQKLYSFNNMPEY